MGKQLLREITEATGLPPELITKELQTLLEKSGRSVESLTLADLRQILTEYLQDVFIEAQDAYD